jgi:apolipoprotein N-acyltransferase
MAYSPDDDVIDYGAPASDSSDTGGSNFWETASAVIDIAGNIVQVFDQNGNDVTDQVEEVNVSDTGASADDSDTTLYWILGSIFFIIMVLMIFLLLRKKK